MEGPRVLPRVSFSFLKNGSSTRWSFHRQELLPQLHQGYDGRRRRRNRNDQDHIGAELSGTIELCLFLPHGLAYSRIAGVDCLHLMAQPKTYQNRIELLQGTLDMLILKTLQWGEQHGYGISQAIRVTSGDVLQVETGSLYPALHRLERQGWVSAEWKKSESNQRAKFYRITALGKKQLASDYERWGRMVASIEGIMSAKRSEV
jgi:PadR family transcriptional regulator PadR